MANNFKNAVIRNVSADSTLPTVLYSVPNSKKSIAIELDVANKGSAGVNVTVQIEDESQNETKDQAGTVQNVNAHVPGGCGPHLSAGGHLARPGMAG